MKTIVRGVAVNQNDKVDDILKKLDELVKAKTEEAVRTLHAEIEEAITSAGIEITKTINLDKKDSKSKGETDRNKEKITK